MSWNKKSSNSGTRTYVAVATLIISGSAIIAVTIGAIIVKPDNIMTIFNIVLPVLASWVGTILAFYFGRENFEAANQQVRALVQRLTPEQQVNQPVSSIMRVLGLMSYFQIPKGKKEKDVELSELSKKFTGNISRLPIIDEAMKPRYMIHESSINKYIKEGGKDTDNLDDFTAAQKKAGIEFGLNKGFIVVAERTTLSEAKKKMEDIPICQDIFITKEGKSKEKLIGWISNIRLAKYLEG